MKQNRIRSEIRIPRKKRYDCHLSRPLTNSDMPLWNVLSAAHCAASCLITRYRSLSIKLLHTCNAHHSHSACAVLVVVVCSLNSLMWLLCIANRHRFFLHVHLFSIWCDVSHTIMQLPHGYNALDGSTSHTQMTCPSGVVHFRSISWFVLLKVHVYDVRWQFDALMPSHLVCCRTAESH